MNEYFKKDEFYPTPATLLDQLTEGVDWQQVK